MRYAPGTYLKYNVPHSAHMHGVPVEVVEHSHKDMVAVRFLRNYTIAPDIIQTFGDYTYDVRLELLVPATQLDVDNWILEQELTS